MATEYQKVGWYYNDTSGNIPWNITTKDLDPLEIGGNVTWTAPVVDDRVALYRIYVANTPTGWGSVKQRVFFLTVLVS